MRCLSCQPVGGFLANLSKLYTERVVMVYMGLRGRWSRFSQWVENLPRVGYALLGALLGALAAGVTSFLLSGGVSLSSVIGAAIGLGIANYALGPP
jgi:hypothetical protein